MSLPPKKVTRKLTPSAALARLRAAFRAHLGIGTKTADALLLGASLYDKAYELSCLIETMRHLRGFTPSSSFHLIGGSKPKFRSKGGEIQRGVWPYIEMRVSSRVVAEIWVDIECLALSAWTLGKTPGNPPFGGAHELDVVLVHPNTSGRPRPDNLALGIEAKHRPFNKALLKELLGVRRETGFAGHTSTNQFAWWRPDRRLPVHPLTGIVLFCSDSSVLSYNDPTEFWGIEMVHHPF